MFLCKSNVKIARQTLNIKVLDLIILSKNPIIRKTLGDNKAVTCIPTIF